MSLFGGGGSAPTPPRFRPIDIQKTETDAVNADVAGYNLSDTDFANRFPGLVSGRTQQTQNAYKQLTGPLDPTVQNQFVNQGLSQSLSAFGGGNPNASITPKSAAGNAVATSLANNVQKKQDYDRSYFEQTLGYNPQRTFGLSGEDAVNMSVANIIGRNNYLQARYGGAVSSNNAQNQQRAQQEAAAAAAAVQIITSVIAASDERLKEDIKTVGEHDGLPVKTFKFKHDPKGETHTGFMAQDVEKIKPWAVLTDPITGLKSVNYAMALYKG